MDSYRILGLKPGASPAEVKRAYRRLAMAWHPDRNSHPEATERFKEIRAAYDTLQGQEGLEEAADPPADETPAPPRAPDIRLDLELTLEEAAFGCSKAVELRRSSPCATCEGTGESGISRTRFCGTCHGSGRIRHRQHGLESCPDCNGKGVFREQTCPDCQGSGEEVEVVSLMVSVPAGMAGGDELRLAGQGEPGSGNLAAGDLFLKIALRPHELFGLEGRDLSYELPVSALKLLVGGSMRIPGLGGVEEIALEAGAPEPRAVRLSGRGFPGRRAGEAGDLVIRLRPAWPSRLNQALRRRLREIDAALESGADDALPEVSAWRKRYGV